MFGDIEGALHASLFSPGSDAQLSLALSLLTNKMGPYSVAGRSV